MRLLRFDVDGLLGLKGSIDFTNRPILIYGKNITGKSNIVNLIRYLLIKPRGGKKYSESLPLRKEELLLEKQEGSCSLYLSKGQRLYRISLLSRTGRKASASYTISYYTGLSSCDSLPSLKWIQHKEGKGTRMWEDLGALGLYPDLLETLISPSNVKNFQDAISGDLVSIPEMVKKELSGIHAGAKNYLETLEGLEIVLFPEELEVLEKEANLKKEFTDRCSQIGIDPSCFEDIRSLEATQKNIEEMRRACVKQRTQLEKDFESPELRAKIRSLQEAKALMSRKEETARNLKESREAKGRIQETRALGGLLADVKARRIEDIMDAKIPSSASLSGDAREIVERVEEARRLVSKAKEICVTRRIALEDIKRLMPSYRKLLTSIKHPLQGISGARAIIFRDREKSVASIPLDEAESHPEVFVELEPLPKLHITNEQARRETLKTLETSVKAVLSDLKSAEGFLRRAGQSLGSAKKRGSALELEAETAETQAQGFDELLSKTMGELAMVAGSLKMFGIQADVTENVEALPLAFEHLGASLEEADKLLAQDLKRVSPDISPDTPLPKVLEKLQEKKQEVDKKERACADLENWLTRNLPEVARSRSRKATIELLREATSVCKQVLGSIREATDIGVMIESISGHVSKEVETAVKAVLADSDVEFTHLGKGAFECRINGKKITHPSGSERACMSIGVMLSLANCFDVPVILDEALDRIDADNVAPLVSYLTRIGESTQICIVACKSFNIEKNPKLRDILANWRIFRISVKENEKLIEPVSIDSILEQTA